jgi:outer membrane protein
MRSLCDVQDRKNTMKAMKRLILTLAVCLVVPALGAAAQAASPSPAAGSPAAAVPVVTLQQSIDAALASGDDNRILQGTLDVARAQHALTVTKNSFALSASAGAEQNWMLGTSALQSNRILTSTSVATGVQGGLTLAGPLTSVSVTPSFIPADPPGSPDPFTLIGVNVSQTIWNGYWGGPTQAAVDKSLLTLQGKEIGTEASRLGIVYSVKQSYYALLSAQKNLAVKKQILDKQNAVLKQIQAVYDLKLASLADLKTAQLNSLSAEVDVESAAHDLQFARIALATLMGGQPDSAFTVADAPEPAVPAASLQEAVSTGLSHRVELKQIELSLRSSQIDLALARGQGTPTVSVSGGVGVLMDLGSPVTQAESANLALKVSMPVLDAGAVGNQVKSIQSQNSVYNLQISQLRKSITTAVRSAWDGVQIANKKVAVAQLSVEATDLQYQLVSAQRDAGTASNQDLLSAAVNLANAQNSLAGAQSAAELAVLQLQSVMGY